MMVYEALTVVLIVLLATLTTGAIYLGLLNWVGAFHVVRCSACHHLTASSGRQADSCPHCRHPGLLHPIYAAHHRATPVRVRVDRLHY
jgi:hypothetical protein